MENNTEMSEEDLMYEEEENAANTKNDAVVERIAPPRVPYVPGTHQQRVNGGRFGPKIESAKPVPQVEQPKAKEEPRYIAFNQPLRKGVFDTYTKDVFSEDIMEILAHICSELDEIKRSL